ncbi:hypothetical protein ACFOWB_03630 [Chenggangzhangella methanolivorans]|uniref:hypothetical protein n=1 Tax=Chenggangzhangella methanolivorans TaxID=1437009 RepID=UPI00361433D1
MAVLFEGELFADYHQIYVADSKLDFVADYPTQWTDEILAQGVNPGPGVVIVCTARDMNTAFRVELHESEPAIDLDAADHAAECGIVTAGEIIVGGCTSHEGQDSPIAVPAGPLRALVVASGFGTISEDRFDGDDLYVVHLWPGESAGVVVRKQWKWL